MARWLAISSFILGIAMVGLRDTYRAADAAALGGLCETTHGCRKGSSCVHVDGVMEGQCSTTCSDTSGCAERFGAAVMCLGADLCARACDVAEDCPSGTTCNAYGWCERPYQVE